MNFVTQSLCEKMSFPQIDTWKGTMSTIDADRRATFPIHMVTFMDHQGNQYKLPCLATEFIGSKRRIPSVIIEEIARTAKVDSTTLDSVDGPIDILAGVAALDKFPC